MLGTLPYIASLQHFSVFFLFMCAELSSAFVDTLLKLCETQTPRLAITLLDLRELAGTTRFIVDFLRIPTLLFERVMEYPDTQRGALTLRSVFRL